MKPTVLFLCNHNAGRSQLAAALMREHVGSRFEVRSAGLNPADRISEVAAAALAENGIIVSGITPRQVTVDDLTDADVVVTLVSDLELPSEPTRRLIGWSLPDPAAWDLDGIRPLREEIGRRVTALAAELNPS